MKKEIPPIYLLLVDYISSMIVGATSILIPALVIPHGWHMVMAMAAGMVLAMLGALLIVNTVAPLTGPFEVAMPAMIISMIVGMVPVEYFSGFSLLILSIYGMGAGMAVQLVFHLYDYYLHGEVKL